MATAESLVAQIQGLSSNAMDFVIAVRKRFKDQVLMLEVPMRGVAPVLEAVKKLRSSSEHLTALHRIFFNFVCWAFKPWLLSSLHYATNNRQGIHSLARNKSSYGSTRYPVPKA
ncbi:hypothetical protein NC652_037992 [Populus alba x Populus x berolinensis]|nr:hypothetical protein NC652_037992 [Populus alba x Populus x berolinensis]